MSITYNGTRRSYKTTNGRTDYSNPILETLVDHQEFIGMVVTTTHQTEQIMSDVWEEATYAVVFNQETRKFKQVFLWMTGQTNPELKITCMVDATDEVKEFYQAYLQAYQEAHNFNRRERAYDTRQNEIQVRRHNPCLRDRKVVVVKGRKVPLKTCGKVIWVGVDSYGNTKLGIATSDRREGNKYADVAWTAASNCIPVNPFDGF